MKIGLPHGPDGTLEFATVKKRAVDIEGKHIGKPHSQKLLDSREYIVQLLNGDTEIFTANTIAENSLAQVDKEGHQQLLIDEIIDHRTLKDAIPKSDGTFKTHHGAIRKVKITHGWEICVKWKDGSTDWVALKDLKDSYPVELAKYVVQHQL